MAFRKYGGLNYAASNNIVRNHYGNSDNFTVSNVVGQYNSKIVSESHFDMSANSLLNVESIYFMDGSIISGGTENGNFTINGDLHVIGNSLLDGPVETGSDASIGNNLIVVGSSDLINDVTIGGNLGVTGSSNLVGDVTIGGNLTVENGIINAPATLILNSNGSVEVPDVSGQTANQYAANTKYVSDNTYWRETEQTAGGSTSFYAGNDSYATQNVTVISGSFSASSDYRIKENIESLPESITIDHLNPIIYTQKETNKKNIGFLAHEVQEVFPFLVEGIKDGPNMQSLNYIGLIGVLTKEIQELKKRVEKLELK